MFGRSLKKSLVLSAAALSLCVGSTASADGSLSFSFFDINGCNTYGASYFQTSSFSSYAPAPVVVESAVAYGNCGPTYSYFGGYRPYTTFSYGYVPVYQPVVYYAAPVVYCPPPVMVCDPVYVAPVYYRPVYRPVVTYFDTCYPSYGFSTYYGSYSSYSSFSFGLSFSYSSGYHGNYYGYGGNYYDGCHPHYYRPAYGCRPEPYFRPHGGPLPAYANTDRRADSGASGGVMGTSQLDKPRWNGDSGSASIDRSASSKPVSIMGPSRDVASGKPDPRSMNSKPASFVPGAFKPVGADQGKVPQPLPSTVATAKPTSFNTGKPSAVAGAAKPDAPAAPSNFKPTPSNFQPAPSKPTPVSGPSSAPAVPGKTPFVAPPSAPTAGKPVTPTQTPAAPTFQQNGPAKPTAVPSAPASSPAPAASLPGKQPEGKPIMMPRNTEQVASKPVYVPKVPSAPAPSAQTSPSGKGPAAFRSQGPSGQPSAGRSAPGPQPMAAPAQRPSTGPSAPMAQPRSAAPAQAPMGQGKGPSMGGGMGPAMSPGMGGGAMGPGMGSKDRR